MVLCCIASDSNFCAFTIPLKKVRGTLSNTSSSFSCISPEPLELFASLSEELSDENLIYKNTANTSSLTLRGCVMIFEPETCLYVSSIPKP